MDKSNKGKRIMAQGTSEPPGPVSSVSGFPGSTDGYHVTGKTTGVRLVPGPSLVHQWPSGTFHMSKLTWIQGVRGPE
jgi:hypothetical protein